MHALLHALLSFVATHPVEVTLALCGAVSAVVAQLPARYAALPVVGWLVRRVDQLSVLTHREDPGTLKWPGVASAALAAALAPAPELPPSERPTPTDPIRPAIPPPPPRERN